MLSKIRSRLTYANVAATLALVFAMSGGAMAASHYIITSKSQIKPSVLKSLKGKQGKAGARGPAGAGGATGAAGPAGPAGTSLAWAAVVTNSAGNPSIGAGSGFTTVSHPQAGIYCLGPSIAGHPVLVTPAGDANIFAMGPSEVCTGSYQIEVNTANLASGQGFIAAVP